MGAPRTRFDFVVKRDPSQIGHNENWVADQTFLISAGCIADLERNRGC